MIPKHLQRSKSEGFHTTEQMGRLKWVFDWCKWPKTYGDQLQTTVGHTVAYCVPNFSSCSLSYSLTRQLLSHGCQTIYSLSHVNFKVPDIRV